MGAWLGAPAAHFITGKCLPALTESGSISKGTWHTNNRGNQCRSHHCSAPPMDRSCCFSPVAILSLGINETVLHCSVLAHYMYGKTIPAALESLLLGDLGVPYAQTSKRTKQLSNFQEQKDINIHFTNREIELHLICISVSVQSTSAAHHALVSSDRP